MTVRGEAKLRQGDLSGGLADYREALHVSPSSACNWADRGDESFRRGDFDGATVEYSEAIRLDQGRSTSWCGRGAARLARGDCKSAMADCEEALRANPNLVPALRLRGAVRLRQCECDEAVADCRAAVKLDPRDALAWHILGEALTSKGDCSGVAEKDGPCLKALRLDPRLAVTRSLCKGRQCDKHVERAGELELLVFDSCLGPAWFDEGSAKLERSPYDHAAEDVRIALKMNPRLSLDFFRFERRRQGKI